MQQTSACLSASFTVLVLAVFVLSAVGPQCYACAVWQAVRRLVVGSDDAEDVLLRTPTQNRKHLAILVSGSFRRFFLRSMAIKLVAPTVMQGHTVDVFTFLVTGKHTPWKTDMRPYLKALTWDPIFGPASVQQLSHKHIRTTITEAITSAGGFARYVELRDTVSLDDDVRLQYLRREAKWRFPEEDPDSRFPTRPLGRSATAADANRNMLRLFRALEWTFDAMVAHERLQGYTYDLVLVERDDAQWMQPFDLDALLHSGGPEAELYVPQCSKRYRKYPTDAGAAKPMLPSEMCDHVQLLARNRAGLLGRYYSRFFENSSKCHVDSSSTQSGVHQTRSCTSEELLRWTMVTTGVKWHAAAQKLLPYERSAHIKTPSHGVLECFHKYCQTFWGKLHFNTSQRMCQDSYITRRLGSAEYYEKCSAPSKTGDLPTGTTKKRVAIYTVSTGAYDHHAPTYNCFDVMARMSQSFRSLFDISCLAIVDSTAGAHIAAETGWIPLLLSQAKEPQRQQRRIKILGWNTSHKPVVGPQLDNFDIVVYHDSKNGLPYHLSGDNSSEVVCLLEKRLTRSLKLVANGRVELVAYAHTVRISTAEELDAVTCKGLCSTEAVKKVRALHHTSRYRDREILADTSNLIWRARGRSLALQQGMAAWIDALETTGCMRDQVNFDFAMWKHKLRYKLLPDQARPFIKVRNHRLPHTRYYTTMWGHTVTYRTDVTTRSERICFDLIRVKRRIMTW
eukprot:CAMPEP_0119303114 /NCGR_PEP_ID=MMETSP1333-20130426/4595_1 /TAXON_ID=418940 /ORGANISM="Scyphosphaera apsteinii, Strain RCC1455" /LENGTH=734 /DNA_ID=CAMNT_0007305695 /DNA_START=112 /DNA_END=2313 /DNA_ORIENTATION=+